MSEPLERFKMQTNFAGLIQLLAKHLYSEPDVFVRELIQNAHDGIQRRRDEETNLAGRIDIEADRMSRTIVFRDNGIGMDRSDIKEFLAVIGSTGTGTARKKLVEKGLSPAYETIGQFGIGMLSAFVVAEKVIVRTRKLGEAEAFAWHNAGSTDCELYADTKEIVGSEITVFVRPDFEFMLEEGRLQEAIIKYCDFIPFPISLNGQSPINTMDAPWHREHWASQAEKESTYRIAVIRRFPQDLLLDIIPIEIDKPYRARGVLYITDRSVADINTAGVIDIFVRRMFIRAADNDFLPYWAKFIGGIIDSPDLQPNAARDNIQRKEPAAEFLQKRLGELIVERLSYLAKHDPKKFEKINVWHHYHLKGMALYYADFFKQVIDLLLFETNTGRMSLKEYLTKNAPKPEKGNLVPIYYVAHFGATTQFYSLAQAHGWVVINAGYQFDEAVLQKYAERNRHTAYLERLDATDNPELFKPLNDIESERFRQLELDMEGHLRRITPNNVTVRLRHFMPVELPAVLIVTPSTQAEEKLYDLVTQRWFMDGMEDVVKDVLEQNIRRPLYLSLNVANSLIQALNDANRRHEAVREVMSGVFYGAMLNSLNLLNQRNAETMHSYLAGLLNRIMDYGQKIEEMQQTLERERGQLLEMNQQQARLRPPEPEHVLIFMITPFADQYKKLEDAVRRVFERAPYYFEVRLARDYTHTSSLFANVREHILRASAFIADISELNPNVMLELGAALFTQDGRQRPVFSLRSQNALKDVPADLQEKLYIYYDALDTSVENLEAKIREAFERDGRPIHDDLRTLVNQRKKRFLSRMLLSGLRTQLRPKELEGMLKNYATVEDLLAAAPTDIIKATGLDEYLVVAIQGELKKEN